MCPNAETPNTDRVAGVLIVDDNAAFRSVARTVLEAGGYRVTAEVGTGAAAILAAAQVKPDLVLLDIGLPDQDGFVTCRQLHATQPNLVIVLCSIRDEDEYGDAIARSSAAGFLAKAQLSADELRRIATA
ncbi:Response regulator receiver domain-containing protein [Kibdelosporangium aridum]|uniref:Response regulator receiver domain-containing protein n=1 Tax=Kibdelosporangium aridum TaxID=2030 RepID=A0A1W2FRE1_KIBAR|nr:Response regulator receiver domain-containing protein [Kibdelosporangium aridum]